MDNNFTPFECSQLHDAGFIVTNNHAISFKTDGTDKVTTQIWLAMGQWSVLTTISVITDDRRRAVSEAIFQRHR